MSDQNKELPEYLLTKDGFTILAMGYTGPKAMAFKEDNLDKNFTALNFEASEYKDSKGRRCL